MANQNILQSLISPLDPSSAARAYEIQRQQAIAEALQKQALEPAQLPQNMPIMPRYGAGLGLTQLAKALLSDFASKQADSNAGALQESNTKAIAAALDPNQGMSNASYAMGQGATQGSVGPTENNAQIMNNIPAGETHKGSALNPLGVNKDLAAMALRNAPDKFWEAQMNYYKPTEATLLARAAGANPMQANQAALTKANYIAPVNAHEGATLFDSIAGKPIFNAPNKEGIQYQFDASGRPIASAVPGFSDALSQFEAAKVRGRNQQTLASPEYSQVTPQGQIIPRSIDSTLNPQQASLPQNKWQFSSQFPNVQGVPMPAVGPQSNGAVGPMYGQKEGAELAQREMSKQWQDIQSSSKNAELTKSQLITIKEYAKKANTGNFSDQLNYANSIAALFGAGPSNDINTANAVIDKNAAALIMNRSNESSNVTDNLRALASSSGPGRKMPEDAINKVVNNLIAVEDMKQARVNIVSEYANSRNPQEFSRKLSTFNQNSDPRIFEYSNMNPQQAAAFKANLARTGELANFSKKIKELQKLGVQF